MVNSFWQVLDTGCSSAEENMRFDAELLDKAYSYSIPVLHFYEWKQDSATYGYFVQPSQFINMDQAFAKGLSLARRPTGGGIIFHIWDMAFSLLIPAHLPEYSINTLENYAFVNDAVLQAIQEFLQDAAPLSLVKEDGFALDPACQYFCMAKPTKYDVLLGGKKVAGAAQRKTKKGFLHQGSISLRLPPQEYLDEILLPGTSVGQAMQRVTCPLLDKDASASQTQTAKEKLKLFLATHLNQASLKYRS